MTGVTVAKSSASLRSRAAAALVTVMVGGGVLVALLVLGLHQLRPASSAVRIDEPACLTSDPIHLPCPVGS